MQESTAYNVFAFLNDDTGPIEIPKSFEEAMASRFAHKWLEAMQKEIAGPSVPDSPLPAPEHLVQQR